MPIVNLTQFSEVGSGLPRLAKVHKGDKKEKDSNRPGKDLDYFRVVFEPEFADLQETWDEIYTTEPDCFERVYMTYPSVDEAFATWKEEWNASQTLLHRCDGEHQVLWYSQAAQAYSHAKEKCASAGASPCGCKNVGRLNLLIPEFIEIAGILGYVTVETHSINDILTVYRTLADVQRINGTLLGVPFSLGRVGQQISAPDTKNKRRIKVTKSLFYLYPDPEFTRTVMLPRLVQSGGFLAAQQPALPTPAPKLDTETAKGLLGTGDGIRRLGAVSAPEVATPAPTPAPAETPKTEPAPAQPQPEVQTVAGTVVGIDTVGNALGQLKTKALKEIFNGNTKAMNKCISDLIGSGKLPPIMSVDEALKVIKAASCPETVPETANENETVVQPTMPGMPRVAEPM